MKENTEKSINSIVNTIATLKKAGVVCCYIGGAYAFLFLMVPKLFGDAQQAGSYSSVSADSSPPVYFDPQGVAIGTGVEEWKETTTSPKIRALYEKAAEPNRIKQKIASVFPQMAGKETIRPLGDGGSLFEVEVAGKKFLMSSDGNYIIEHSYIDISDLRTGEDVDMIKTVELINYYPQAGVAKPKAEDEGEKSQPIADSGNSDFEKLKSTGIYYPTTNSDRKGELVIFSDVTCPACKAFHSAYQQNVLNAGWDIYIAPLSRAGKSGGVHTVSNRLYCSANKKDAYEALITGSANANSIDFGSINQSCIDQQYASHSFDLLLSLLNGSGFTPAIWVDGENSKVMKANEFMADYL